MAQNQRTEETVCGFTISIPSSRSQYEDGNFVLYNSSDVIGDPKIWKLCLEPIDHNDRIQGEVSKLSISNLENCPFSWPEAESAIHGAFTGDTKVKKRNLSQSIEVSLDGERCHNVAFTLRGYGFEQFANQDEELNVGDTTVRIQTSLITQEDTLDCVYGLASWQRRKTSV